MIDKFKYSYTIFIIYSVGNQSDKSALHLKN